MAATRQAIEHEAARPRRDERPRPHIQSRRSRTNRSSTRRSTTRNVCSAPFQTNADSGRPAAPSSQADRPRHVASHPAARRRRRLADRFGRVRRHARRPQISQARASRHRQPERPAGHARTHRSISTKSGRTEPVNGVITHPDHIVLREPSGRIDDVADRGHGIPRRFASRSRPTSAATMPSEPASASHAQGRGTHRDPRRVRASVTIREVTHGSS